MKIAVDLDDTLSIVPRKKYIEAYLSRKNLPFRIVDPDAQKMVELCDWTEEDAKAFLNDGGLVVFTDAEVRRGARETLAKWRSAGHEITILTSRPQSWFQNPELLSRDWLQKRKIPYDKLVARCSDKGMYCAEHGISVLIDNDVSNCLSVQNRGMYAILALGKHTSGLDHGVNLAAADWLGIDRCLEIVERNLGKGQAF